MTLEELQETDWYKERPDIIKNAIIKCPPIDLYSLNSRQCQIIAYSEPELENDEVTVRVQKTGIGGPMAEMGLGMLDTNQVFGVKLSDLELWKE